jgi:quinol monooxygenase YgiN
MPSEEIAALGFFTIKAGREQDCNELAKKLMESTHTQDQGCIYYAFFKMKDNPNEFIIHERWKDLASVQAHLARLTKEYGSTAAIFESFEGQPKFLNLQLIE